MKRLTHRIASGLGRFLRREQGIMAAETVIMLPIFLLCTIGMYTYWDAFRALNSSQKATYTVSDMIARTMQPVDEPYLVGLRDTMQHLGHGRFHRLRIREVRRETPECVSLTFEVPAELAAEYRFVQGQHLNVRAMLDGEEVLDNQDLCLLLKVGIRTLQRYRAIGVLPYFTISGKVFYRTKDVHEFIRTRFADVEERAAKRKEKEARKEERRRKRGLFP